jgi:type IX secretion system PorP/SprF family membrane protein
LNRNFIILLLTTVAHIASAQQLPLYNQYLYNKFLINPAHAGSDGFTSFNVTVREQWVGYSGAPRTYSFSIQTRILKKDHEITKNIFNKKVYRPKTDGKIGLGAYVFSDHNGLIQRTGFQVAYSYNMWLADYTQLSMGLGFTGYHFFINATELSFGERGEPWVTENLRRGVFIPDADFGLYLLNPKFDLGFSALQMFGAAVRIGDYAYRNYKMDRHFYLFGSYTIATDNRTNLEPSFLMKISEQLKPQLDLGLTYIYDQKVWAGLTYRTNTGIIANIRFRYIPVHENQSALFIGYAVDFSLNQIQTVTYGTHELTIALKFGDSRRKYRWLDRY